jgi:hypothetical protein
MQLLNENFFSIVVGRILQIPINDQGFDDSVSWSFTKHGRYIVVQAIIYSGDTFFFSRELISWHSLEDHHKPQFGKCFGG